MQTFRYIPNISTLKLDTDKCVGCGECKKVCPHSVFEINKTKAAIKDLTGCMECGACHQNCPASAIEVNPGVGCAAYVISSWIFGAKGPLCGGSGGCG